MARRVANLVTGGAGFVGRSLVTGLLRDGEDVMVLDNLLEGRHPAGWLPDGYRRTSQGDKWLLFEHNNYGNLSFRDADIRTALPELHDRDIGDVYHLAAVIGGRTSIEGEPLRVATDLALDAELLNWAVDVEPDRLLYASSSAAYPTALQNGTRSLKLKEDFISFDGEIGAPDMTYGWAKLTGEYLARLAADRHDLSIACVRPFSGYGEGQSFDYPIPAIARRAVHRADPLTVWGSGRQFRDFVHVDDAVVAMRRAITAIEDGSAVNIGTGRPTNFLEVARQFASIAGYRPRIATKPDKPEGPSYRCADPTKMRQVLGWEPEIDIKRGFERVYQDVRSRIETVGDTARR